jgi:hypothetical protein
MTHAGVGRTLPRHSLMRMDPQTHLSPPVRNGGWVYPSRTPPTCPHIGGSALAVSSRGPATTQSRSWRPVHAPSQSHKHPTMHRDRVNSLLGPPARAGGYHPIITWRLTTPPKRRRCIPKTISGFRKIRIHPGFQRSCPPFSGVDPVATPRRRGPSAIGDARPNDQLPHKIICNERQANCTRDI